MTLILRVLIAALLLCLSHSAPAIFTASSANLLINSDFDDGLLYWTVDDSTAVEWFANYDAPPPGSSSLGAVAIFGVNRFLQQGVSQCVTVERAAKYEFTAWTIATCPGNAQIEIAWNERPDCDSGYVIGADQISSTEVSNDWQAIQSILVSPDTALGATISFQNASACNEAVIFDDTFFGDHIFSDSFDQGAHDSTL